MGVSTLNHFQEILIRPHKKIARDLIGVEDRESMLEFGTSGYDDNVVIEEPNSAYEQPDATEERKNARPSRVNTRSAKPAATTPLTRNVYGTEEVLDDIDEPTETADAYDEDANTTDTVDNTTDNIDNEETDDHEGDVVETVVESQPQPQPKQAKAAKKTTA
jgi:hypothetical protein